MSAYYNEIDKNAAAWLRELIKGGHIADGEVDERDIQDISPADIRGFSQCHFFAGIGVWSYALRRAGWPDDRPVWTGSCPCQPFSSAGKGGGFDDERHLWPSWHWLIAQCGPAVVFGEQVASKDAEPWLDLVQADLEGLDYAVGAEPYPSAGIGAPHIRDRLYWVADAVPAGWAERWAIPRRGSPSGSGGAGGMVDPISERRRLGQSGGEDAADVTLAVEACRLAEPNGGQLQGLSEAEPNGGQLQGLSELRGPERDGYDTGRAQSGRGVAARGDDSGLADAAASRHAEARQHERGSSQLSSRSTEHGRVGRLVLTGTEDGAGAPGGHGARDLAAPTGPVNGLWRDADWLYCRDGIWRPVEPGTFPLAHGAPARVGRLRGYGNAINAEAAVAFIGSYLEATA